MDKIAAQAAVAELFGSGRGAVRSRSCFEDIYKRALHFYGVDIFEIIVCQRSLTLR
jgi:hypothetical protein